MSEKELDPNEFESHANPERGLFVDFLRSKAGTIMTDWQVATALQRLTEMTETVVSKDVYKKAMNAIVENLPEQLIADFKEGMKQITKKVEEEAASFDEAHKRKVESLEEEKKQARAARRREQRRAARERKRGEKT